MEKRRASYAANRAKETPEEATDRRETRRQWQQMNRKDLDNLKLKFLQRINEHPDQPCMVCRKLLYKGQVIFKKTLTALYLKLFLFLG